MEDEKIKQVLMDRLKREAELTQNKKEALKEKPAFVQDLQQYLQGYSEAIHNVCWDLFKKPLELISGDESVEG
jgi:proline dehydrogenase